MYVYFLGKEKALQQATKGLLSQRRLLSTET